MTVLVCKVWGPQLDGQCSIESLEVAVGRIDPDNPRRKCGMVHSVSCKGSGRHAGIDVELYKVPVISGREEPIKPG